jgi:peptidoglycan hydrolase-like protein with peptidoglycan-binding domain
MQLTLDQRNAVVVKAGQLGVEAAALFAVVEVESNGIIGELINGRLEPTVRYEGHYFDKLCKTAVRDAARKAGVSAKKAGVIKNPRSQRSRWNLILKASTFDVSAAYQSVSYGIGQVMGSHWKILGYNSIDDLVAHARSGFIGQLDLMCRYIVKFGLLDELRSLDFSGFARGYNGPNYAKYGYHIKLQEAYYAYGGGNQISAVRSGALRIGSKGAGVRDVQALLKLAGYNVEVDGDFGTTTKAAIMQFQRSKGLTADGIVGPKTQQALSHYRDSTVEEPGQAKLLNVEGVQKGAAVALAIPAAIQSTKATVESVVEQIAPYQFLSGVADTLNIALGVLTVSSILFGAGYAFYKWRQSKKTYTGVKVDPITFNAGLDEGPLVLPPATG